MCNPIEELFGTPIPERVWHYTSLAGLEGILTSGVMWATDARFTNDRTEFIHARDIAESCIQSLESTGVMPGFPSLDLRGMLDHAFEKGPLSPIENEVYLVSFSDSRDLLSQWREYASGGAGVSIAFDLRNIRPPREAEIAVTFAPCVYKPGEKERLVRSTLTGFTDAVALLDRQSRDGSWFNRQIADWTMVDRIFGLTFDRAEFTEANTKKFTKELLSAWRRTLFDLLRVASHCKDAAFSEEREWRLAMPRPTSRPSVEHPVKFRGTNRNLPYFESNLFHEGTLPIVEIMAGPLCTEIERVRDVMNRTGYRCLITASNAPLRDTRNL